MSERRIITMILLLLTGLTLMACDSNQQNPFASSPFTPLPFASNNQAPEYSAAQATLAAGQNQIMELSHQATAASLSIDQNANAAAQATSDYYQRQLMELSIRGTEVSQNMAWAAATQGFIAEQTQAVLEATGTAQSQAATATYAAYSLNATQSAQANATQVAQSLTATPFAAIQADILRTRNESERRAFWGEFVVTPVKLILGTLIILLLIVGGVLAYQRLMPILELRLRTIARMDDSTFLLVDGKIVDLDTPQQQFGQALLRPFKNQQLPRVEAPGVEIVGPAEPSVINWITEAEMKLHTNGRMRS